MSSPAALSRGLASADTIRREAAWEAARRYAGRSRAESTWRGYRSAWERFETWCGSIGATALPATPDTVAMFVAAEADAGRANATLEHRLSAIRLVHLGAGHPSPHNALAVVEVMRGVRRDRHGQARFRPRKVEAALDERLCAMVDTLRSESLRDLRDRAMLLYGFATALRCSELVRLDVADIESGPRGDLVHIRYSKGDQIGTGQRVAALSVWGSPYCPVRSLRTWLRAAGIQSGPLFRAVRRSGSIAPHRLSAKTVVRLIKRTAADAGFDARRYAGHSLRRGFLTSAAMHRADVLKMAAQSRHASLDTILGYVNDQRLFDDHAGAALLRIRPLRGRRSP